MKHGLPAVENHNPQDFVTILDQDLARMIRGFREMILPGIRVTREY